MKKLTMVVCGVALSGCATGMQWSKPGGTEQEFYADRYECEQGAASSYPASPTQIMTSPGVQMPAQQQVQTNCVGYGATLNCTSQPVGINTAIYNRPPAYMTVDANVGNRSNAARSCLMAKGYRSH